MIPDLTLGQGHLDVLRSEAEAILLVGGWYLADDGRPVAALEVRLDGTALPILLQRLAAPSPDVAQAFPGRTGCEGARFYARVTTGGAEPQPGAWVHVVPRLAGGGRGLGLHALYAPTIARPDAGSVDSIGGGYELQALEFLRYFVDLCGLPREGRVLDVGCGIGRMAFGLTGYLTGRAEYLGFDVMPDAIATARATVGAGRPRFRFEHVDLANLMYHATGGATATGFRFPVADQWADLVFLTSVITHLRPRETRHYLQEIGRVLALSGRALVTAFVFDDEVERLVATGASTQHFFAWEGSWTIDRAVPEKAIGFVRDDLERWIAEAGLTIERLLPGTWCGRTGGLSYQDVLVLKR